MKTTPLQPDQKLFSTRRIEAITDGVFAIAMTLLVLDLKPDMLGHATTSRELFDALYAARSSITSFLVSFLLLGSMWAVHMRQFEYITRADRHLTFINTLRLLAVVMIPLTTSLSGAYSSLVLGRILLPINFAALAALGFWQWNYAKRLHQDKLDKDIANYAAARNRVTLYIALLVIPLSVVVGELAFAAFIALPYIPSRTYRD